MRNLCISYDVVFTTRAAQDRLGHCARSHCIELRANLRELRSQHFYELAYMRGGCAPTRACTKSSVQGRIAKQKVASKCKAKII